MNIRLGRLQICWWWKKRWIKPKYGLKLEDYDIGLIVWEDGHRTEVVKINTKRNKIKIQSIDDDDGILTVKSDSKLSGENVTYGRMVARSLGYLDAVTKGKEDESHSQNR